MKNVLLILAWTAGAYFAGCMMLEAILRALGHKLTASAYMFYAPAVTLWLIGLATSGLALRWSYSSVQRHFWPAAISSALAIGISCTGLTRIHIVSTTTTNGQVSWQIRSWWFFIAPLILGVLALTFTLWRRGRSNVVV
jgi:hypothetical protein